jgi:hypothetical protein
MNQEVFYNQSWFWVGFFTAIASIGGILIKEWLSRKSQLEIEKIKLYESDIFRAYCELYEFTSRAFTALWPPNDPRVDFINFMENVYFKKYKKYKLFYEPTVRSILEKFESQYHCLRELDFLPEKEFNKFYDEDLIDLLNKMQKIAEAKSDIILRH